MTNCILIKICINQKRVLKLFTNLCNYISYLGLGLRLFVQLVECSPALDQALGRVELGHTAITQYQNSVRVEDSLDAMGNRDHRGSFETLANGLLDKLICFHIDVRCRFIDKHQPAVP